MRLYKPLNLAANQALPFWIRKIIVQTGQREFLPNVELNSLRAFALTPGIICPLACPRHSCKPYEDYPSECCIF